MISQPVSNMPVGFFIGCTWGLLLARSGGAVNVCQSDDFCFFCLFSGRIMGPDAVVLIDIFCLLKLSSAPFCVQIFYSCLRLPKGVR